jgi:hypothetical protein
MYAVLNFLDQFTVLIWIDLGLTLVQRLQGFNHISKHRQQNRQLFLSTACSTLESKSELHDVDPGRWW